MRLIALILLIASQSFAQGIDDSKLSSEPALGGVVDYDPLLFMSFFDVDELEAIISDPKNEENPLTKSLMVEKATGNPEDIKPAVVLTKSDALQELQEIAAAHPNYVRGYILLDQVHRSDFASYDLYSENGGLIESGNMRNKKNIRVPWSAEGTVRLILHSISGSGASYLFNASP
jgi:hypothetical protein